MSTRPTLRDHWRRGQRGWPASFPLVQFPNAPLVVALGAWLVAALTDGAALYNTKAAPNGILSVGPDGDAVRMGADSLRAVNKVLVRIHPTASVGIG